MKGNSKMGNNYTETKKQEVWAARQQGMTLKEIAVKNGIALTTVKLWLKEASQHNVPGIQIRRYFPTDEQKKILEEHKKGLSAKAICEKYQIHKSTLSRWKANHTVIATSHMGTEYTAVQIRRMKRALDSLRFKNEVIRACRCSASASIEERVKEVQRLQDRFSPYVICKVLNLSRSTFYRVSLGQKKVTLYEKTDDALRSVIQTEFSDSGERFGASMIKVKLAERGFQVSKVHIQ